MTNIKWSTRPFDQCVKLFSGGTPSMQVPEYWDGTIPWVSSKDMKVQRLYDTQDHITEEGASNGSRLVPPGTILIVVRSMILAREFPITIVMRKVAFNQDLKAVVPVEDVDNAFLYYWLLSNSYHILGITDEAAHGTKRIQTDRLLSLEVLLPPLPTQRAIASILSAYDDLIENNTRRIRILEQMAQAIYQELFGKVDKESLPKGWELVKLGDVADIQWGDTSVTKASYVAEGYTAYSASGADGKLDYYDFDRKGIVLSAIGANCGKTWFAIGRWSCIKNTIRFWSVSEMASTEYLYYVTADVNFWTRRGAAQPFISQGTHAIFLLCVLIKKRWIDLLVSHQTF